jgi:hypothetical protein
MLSIFFGCLLSVEVWRAMRLWNIVELDMHNIVSTAYAIFKLLQQVNIKHVPRTVVTIRSIWKHHNLKLWQNISETNAQVVD